MHNEPVDYDKLIAVSVNKCMVARKPYILQTDFSLSTSRHFTFGYLFAKTFRC